MGFLVFLIVVFVIWALGILIFPPNSMAEKESFKAKVEDLWGVVKICQTASYGEPRLELKPANRSVKMDLHFIESEKAILYLPLGLKKQKAEKANYVELMKKHDLVVYQSEDHLTIYLDRTDENLGELVAHLYRELFEASDSDTVKFTAETLDSDIKVLHHFNSPNYKFNDDYTFDAPSSKHKGKSVLSVQMARILGAVYFLLYPPLIILSYKSWGLTGMCWAALLFFGFFAVYYPIYKEASIPDSLARGSILYCILLSATLVTQNIYFLQSIPSIVGFSTAIISAALALGISSPKSENNIKKKQKDPKEYKFFCTFWAIGGVGLLLFSEWVRRNFTMEDWIWFFGLIRIEFMIAMVVVFTPAYALFYKFVKNVDSKE